MADRRRRPPTHYIPGLIWLTRKQWDLLPQLLDASTYPETDNSVEIERNIDAARADALRSHALMLEGRSRQRYHQRVAEVMLSGKLGLEEQSITRG